MGVKEGPAEGTGETLGKKKTEKFPELINKGHYSFISGISANPKALNKKEYLCRQIMKSQKTTDKENMNFKRI